MEILLHYPHPIVEKATELANSILRNKDFYDRIAHKKVFDLSTALPAEIAELIKNSNLQFEVILFTPNTLVDRIKYRKTFAYTDRNYPNMLFINTLKINREPESIAATLIHESIHALDYYSKEFTFGHGSNQSRNKENTAPYWIGNLAYELLTGGQKNQIHFHEVSETII